jgi:hypothetical protein
LGSRDIIGVCVEYISKSNEEAEDFMSGPRRCKEAGAGNAHNIYLNEDYRKKFHVET